MRKYTLIAWALVQIANMACFTILAITFNKWWIILFAFLFSYSVKGGTE